MAWLCDDGEDAAAVIAELDEDDPDRAEILDAQAALAAVADAALISRGLGIPVRPWELDDWDLDSKLAALALARRWIKSS